MLDLGLKGKVALVSGGSDGLGRATVARLAAEGAQVAACARRGDYLQQVVDQLKEDTGGDILPITMDVTRVDDCERAVADTIAQYGRLDILVNNAGASAAGAFESVTDEAWLADIELKVMGAVRMCLKRVGEAEEYADLVAYLCSRSGSYITGTSINLDGGLCAVD